MGAQIQHSLTGFKTLDIDADKSLFARLSHMDME